MILAGILLAAADYVGIAAIIGAIATLVTAVVAAIVLLIKELRAVKNENRMQGRAVAEQGRNVDQLKALNTQEHEENAARILAIGAKIIERVDEIGEDVVELRVGQDRIEGDLKQERVDRRRGDETILVLIEDLEDRVLDHQPHFTATVTKVPISGGE